jgi:hypothetical protein
MVQPLRELKLVKDSAAEFSLCNLGVSVVFSFHHGDTEVAQRF